MATMAGRLLVLGENMTVWIIIILLFLILLAVAR